MTAPLAQEADVLGAADAGLALAALGDLVQCALLCVKFSGQRRPDYRKAEGVCEADDDPRLVITDVAKLEVAHARGALVLCLDVFNVGPAVLDEVVKQQEYAKENKNTRKYKGRGHCMQGEITRRQFK